MKKIVNLIKLAAAFSLSALISMSASASYITDPWNATYTVTCSGANDPAFNRTYSGIRYPDKELMVYICEVEQGGQAAVRVHN